MEYRKLKELATISISNVDKKTAENEKTVRLCNFVDVYRNWAITENMIPNFMIASAKENEIEKYALHKGDVCITKDSETKDDIGMSTYIADDIDGLVLGYHCALISPDKNVLDGKYLNAFLQTDFVRKFYELNASGSGQRYTLSLDAIGEIPIPVISLEEQKRKGELLSLIDRKIENNNKINDNLFHQALTLYDYWFTQFDFPDNTGKPYKTSGGSMYYCNQLGKSIPLGWNSTTVSKLCVCHDSKRVPLASSERQTMQGNYPYYGATEIMDHIDRYIFDGDYVLLAEDGSIMDKNGHPVLQRISGKSWVNNHAHILEPISGYSCFLLFMLLKDIPVVKIKTGSIQSKITQANLNSYSLIEIPSELREKFISITAPIDKKMLKLKAENESLIKLRSWILPILMSGQATIAD